MGAYGVDVSSNNPHPIAWPALFQYLKALGGGATPFAIIKVNQGTTYLNPDLAGDVAAARAAGFVVAGYMMDQGNADPGQELADFRAHCDLPLADDIELPEGMSVAQYIAHSNVLVNIEPTALEYFNQAQVAEGFSHDPHSLWLAQYNDLPGGTKYVCVMHQYTSSGVVPGTSGLFDLNVWLGTQEQFDNFFKINGGSPVVNGPITNRDVFNAQTREWWYLLRKDTMVAGEQNLLWALYNAPVTTNVGFGLMGYGGSIDLVLANIHDTAGANLK